MRSLRRREDGRTSSGLFLRLCFRRGKESTSPSLLWNWLSDCPSTNIPFPPLRHRLSLSHQPPPPPPPRSRIVTRHPLHPSFRTDRPLSQSSPITGASLDPAELILRAPDLRPYIVNLALERGNMDIIRVLQRVIDHANSRDPGEEKEMDALELSDSEADDVDFTMRRMEEILVKPVLKRTLAAGSTSKTREIDKATELSDELSETVPYNLSLLRKMLAEMRQTREMIGSPSSLSPSESQSTSQIIDPSPTPTQFNAPSSRLHRLQRSPDCEKNILYLPSLHWVVNVV